MHASLYRAIESVFRKEVRISLRSRSSWLVVLMFALTTLSCVSLLMQGDILAPRLAASMLWIILFFSLLAGPGLFRIDDSKSAAWKITPAVSADAGVRFTTDRFTVAPSFRVLYANDREAPLISTAFLLCAGFSW